jgi:hypothetical protein
MQPGDISMTRRWGKSTFQHLVFTLCIKMKSVIISPKATTTFSMIRNFSLNPPEKKKK